MLGLLPNPLFWFGLLPKPNQRTKFYQRTLEISLENFQFAEMKNKQQQIKEKKENNKEENKPTKNK